MSKTTAQDRNMVLFHHGCQLCIKMTRQFCEPHLAFQTFDLYLGLHGTIYTILKIGFVNCVAHSLPNSFLSNTIKIYYILCFFMHIVNASLYRDSRFSYIKKRRGFCKSPFLISFILLLHYPSCRIALIELSSRYNCSRIPRMPRTEL